MKPLSYEDSVRLLKEMIAIPSPSFGEEAVCRHISEFLGRAGIGHDVLKNNIVAFSERFDSQRKTFMLCAHIDTVLPSEDYSFDPYCPGQIEDGKVLGLGSNDDGASVVSMIAAFSRFREKELPFNLMLVLSSEEERSGPDGMTWIWENMKTPSGKPFTPDWAIVGEPTGMKAATSERGLLVIDAVASGVSGHAARNEGVNSIYIALDDINAIRKHRFGRISPVMGEVRMNVTQINAGTAHNIIPEKCSFVIDIRPTELYDNAGLLQELQSVCRSELKARNLRNRSSATRPGSLLLECIEDLGIETYSSPTTSDWMRISCDAFKMGPGDSSRSHHKDEFVYVSEITEGIEGYGRFIEAFAKNFSRVLK